MPPEHDTSFVDLPRSAYPLTLRAFREDNDLLVWQERVDGAGALMIPPLAQEVGCKVYLKVEYADGTVSDSRDGE